MKYLYKTFKEGLKSQHGNIKWEKGKWEKISGELSICNNGFHASKLLTDAMGYVYPEVIALVEVKGDHDIESDKECWSEMRVVNYKKWTKKDSLKLAIFSAELCIKNFEKEYPNDDRPRKAIEACKKVLKNDTEKNRSAARSAASAAWSAASAAESAASANYDKVYKKTMNKIEKYLISNYKLT